MKIDLFKLNNLGEVTLDSDISFDESYYINAGIRKINNLHISGTIKIDYDDCLISNIDVIGEFILPCAISLEDVSYPINVKIEENMGKFEDFYNKNKNTLDILPYTCCKRRTEGCSTKRRRLGSYKRLIVEGRSGNYGSSI